jgi:hypothetical protein
MDDDEQGAEEEQICQEECLLNPGPPLPFEQLEVTLIDAGIAAEIAEFKAVQSYQDEIQRITELMRSRTICYRIIGSVFHMTKEALSQTDERAMNRRSPRRGPSLRTYSE